MSRNSILTLVVSLATLGTSCLAPTDASAGEGFTSVLPGTSSSAPHSGGFAMSRLGSHPGSANTASTGPVSQGTTPAAPGPTAGDWLRLSRERMSQKIGSAQIGPGGLAIGNERLVNTFGDKIQPNKPSAPNLLTDKKLVTGPVAGSGAPSIPNPCLGIPGCTTKPSGTSTGPVAGSGTPAPQSGTPPVAGSGVPVIIIGDGGYSGPVYGHSDRGNPVPHFVPSYQSVVATNGRPASGSFNAIALGWNNAGAWTARKNLSLGIAGDEAVKLCNSQYGDCALSDVAVSAAQFGCMVVSRSNEDATRLFAATGGSPERARAAMSEQLGNAGMTGQLQYSECND